MKRYRGAAGFTLYEFAFVVVIAGLIMAATINAYYVYIQNLRYQTGLTNINAAYSSLSNYQNAKGAYACPSDPTLPITDINFGAEKRVLSGGQWVCWATINLAVGTCNGAGLPYPNSKAGGICREYGARHTLINPNAPGVMDIILIGGLPYRTIKGGEENLNTDTCYAIGTAPPSPTVSCDANGDGIVDAGVYIGAAPAGSAAQTGASFSELSLQGALDGWNDQMSYAVTETATVANTFGQGQYGAIDVQTESGVELLTPAGSSNFVIVSHGDDHSGAYTSGGTLPFPCANFVGQKDFSNCNNGPVFISGIRSLGAGAKHLDDIVLFHNSLISKLWEYVTNSNNIYNLNLGYVAVGTPATAGNGGCVNGTVPIPCQELDVDGFLNAQTQTQSALICDKTNSFCWSPSIIAGPDAQIAAGGDDCPPGDATGDYVMTGMVNGVVQCSAIKMAPTPWPNIASTCPGAKHAIGYNSAGVICK